MNKPDYDWWVKNAHSDSAFLLLMDDADLFEQAICSRLKEVDRPFDQGVVNQAMWRAIHEQDRYGSLSSILADIKELPSSAPNGRFGHVRGHRSGFADADGPFLALGLSAFWVPWAVKNGRDDLLDDIAKWAAKAGASYVRWFGMHDWAGGVDPTNANITNYDGLMREAITELANRGLRSQITLYTRRSMGNEDLFQEWTRDWVPIITDHMDNIHMIEICNEWNHSHNNWTDEEVQRLGHILHSETRAMLALSAPVSGDGWDSIKDRLSHLYSGFNSFKVVTPLHMPRRDNTGEGPWRWVRQPWHMKEGIANCGCPYVDNEHQRWDKSRPQGSRIVSVAAAAPIISWICGCGGSTHHDVYGVYPPDILSGYSKDENSWKLAEVLGKVIPKLPRQLPSWTPSRVGEDWSGVEHPFPELLDQHWSFNSDLDDGVSRAFAALDPSDHKRYVVCLTGVLGTIKLKHKDRSFHIYSLSTGKEIYHGPGAIAFRDEGHPEFGSAVLITSENIT